MNETLITAVVLALVLAVVAVGAAIVVAAVVRAVLHRNSSAEQRGRRAILDLAIDRNRRQVWGAASLGVVAASSEFGSGAGCGGGGCGGGGGGGGGCGGG